MERLTKYVNGVVWYDYKGNKYPAYDMDNSDMLHALNRLGQLEDEAERRERGCGECIRKSCDICTSKIYNYVCDECDDYSNYEPMNYCPTCGRKLVK